MATLLLGITGYILWYQYMRGASVSGPAVYAGSQACASCHEKESVAWQQSHHYHAMEHASEQSVRGDFNNASIEYFGRRTRFHRDGKQFLVTTENEQGQDQTFLVQYTLGYDPLQQYLVSFPDGRVQALPFAWDTRSKQAGGQRWFHLYPGDNITPRNPLFWTRPLQNWNYMCADCHTTGFSKNFSDVENRFDSRWKELGNGCESCHGPGSLHIQQMQKNTASIADRFILPLHAQSQQIDQCGVCHARRDRLKEGVAEEKINDSWKPELLHESLYFSDGQIRDEVFEIGSFMQSKMYGAGVTCSNCHEPHSGSLRAEGNMLCGQCHAPSIYDDKKHHFHLADSKGARCTSCHMPERTYMVVDVRHDHRFSVPRPLQSEKIQSPDACTSCHVGKSKSWAEEVILSHRASGKSPGPPHFGLLLWQARFEKQAAMKSLGSLVTDDRYAAIARASALVELGRHPDQVTVQVISQQLQSQNAMIRGAAVEAMAGWPPEQSMPLLVNHLSDESRAVRFAMAPVVASVDVRVLTAQQQKQRLDLLREYEQWLLEHADRADAQVARASLALARGDREAAQELFEKALQRDPASLAAHLNYADFYRALGDDARAEKLLLKALEIYPDSADAHYALGLLRVRQKQLDEALISLREAAKLAPANSHYAYVYGVGLYEAGNLRNSLHYLKIAQERFPANRAIREAREAYCSEARPRELVIDFCDIQPKQ